MKVICSLVAVGDEGGEGGGAGGGGELGKDREPH